MNSRRGFFYGVPCLATPEKKRPKNPEPGLSGVNGEVGIRTRGTGINPYNGLANRRFQPLSHLSRLPTIELYASSQKSQAESMRRQLFCLI